MHTSNSVRDLVLKYSNTLTYYNKSNQEVIATNLIANGFRIFSEATIVKGFDLYKSIKFNDVIPPDWNVIFPFIKESLIDDVRIIICFENYMKGILLLNDFIVHKLDKKNKSLLNDQQKRPILITEVFNDTIFSEFNKEDKETWYTSSQTLNFSWMLLPLYQSIINLPIDILAIVTKLNEDRNALHFLQIDNYKFGEATIEKYSKILNFVNTTIKKLLIDLNINPDTLAINWN